MSPENSYTDFLEYEISRLHNNSYLEKDEINLNYLGPNRLYKDNRTVLKLEQDRNLLEGLEESYDPITMKYFQSLESKSHSFKKTFNSNHFETNFFSNEIFTGVLNNNVNNEQISGSVFTCMICNNRFDTKEKVIQHNRKHIGDRYFYCEICFKTFREQSAIKPHKNIHFGVKPFRCTLCRRTFRQKIALNIHLKSHDKGKLKHLTPELMKSVSIKKQAYSDYHSNIDSNGKSKIKCWLCQIYFMTQRELLDHANKHKGENIFKCALCLEGFNSKMLLDQHEKKHMGTTTVMCRLCNKMFFDKGSFVLHMSTHGERKQKWNGQIGGTLSFRDMLNIRPPKKIK